MDDISNIPHDHITLIELFNNGNTVLGVVSLGPRYCDKALAKVQICHNEADAWKELARIRNSGNTLFGIMEVTQLWERKRVGVYPIVKGSLPEHCVYEILDRFL